MHAPAKAWRVTLISIHPKELVIMPQKDVNKMTSLIQSLLPTYGIVAIELSKKEIIYEEDIAKGSFDLKTPFIHGLFIFYLFQHHHFTGIAGKWGL